MPKTKLFVVVGCHGDKHVRPCPNLTSRLTKGYGYAEDYLCRAADARLIDGYVEWESEKRKPGDFPDFCPLQEGPND